MSATALLQITQGATVGADGEALKGNTADDVVFSNADDTDVSTWKFELLYVPPGSALSPTTQGPNTTATFNMGTPDVPGCYRVRLTVTDANGDESVDIRNFAVPTPNQDWIIPPDQRDPPPLPLTGTGSKPDELNFGGQAFGWQGDDNSSRKLMYAILTQLDSGTAPGLPTRHADTVTGALNAYTLPSGIKNGDVIDLTLSGSVSLNGIDATGVPAGFTFTLRVGTSAGFSFQVNNENASATATNRINNPLNVFLELGEDEGLVMQRQVTRWAVIGRAGTNAVALLEVTDDFTFIGATSAPTTAFVLQTGDGCWGCVGVTSAGTLAQVGESNHPGALRMTSSSSDNTGIRLYKNAIDWPSGSGGPIVYEQYSSVVWVVRNVTNADTFFRLALSQTIASADNPAAGNAVGFFYDTDQSASLRCVTVAGGVATVTTLAIPTQNTWVRYELRITATQVRFLVDGVLVATHTTNLPSGVGLTPYVLMGTRAASTRSFDVDLYNTRSAAITR